MEEVAKSLSNMFFEEEETHTPSAQVKKGEVVKEEEDKVDEGEENEVDKPKLEGHSHGGEPCHGHGQGHGHSHGGEPCHGHGQGHGHHSHGHSQGHGHSHGGKPCHGHGGESAQVQQLAQDKSNIMMQYLQSLSPEEARVIANEQKELVDLVQQAKNPEERRTHMATLQERSEGLLREAMRKGFTGVTGGASTASTASSSPQFPRLRFPAGHKVQCRVNPTTWMSGTIVKQWFRNPGWPEGRAVPYQIQLDDGMLIMAPMDNDACIRAAELRFKIGDLVECLIRRDQINPTGEWEEGKVVSVNHHEEEWPETKTVPYQVELIKSKMHVFAPMDSDMCIRSKGGDKGGK